MWEDLMIIYITVMVVSVIIIFLLVISYMMFRSFFKNAKISNDLVNIQEPWKSIIEYYKAGERWFMNLPYEVLNICNNGIELYGYYVSNSSRKTVILLHGWKDDANTRMADAKFYIDMGYNIFLPDIRAHGKSQGKYIGMGCKDREDIIKWIYYLQDKYEEETQFVLDGVSMSGAMVLALSGDKDLPDTVRAIVSDSAFTSLAELLPTMVNISPLWIKKTLLYLTEMWCKLLAGYSFSNDTPVKQVANSKTPILFIHGEADTFVPFIMSHKLFETCSSEKEYLYVKGATHAQASWVDKSNYEKKIRNFLMTYVEGSLK